MRLFLSFDLEEETKKKVCTVLSESQQSFGRSVRWVKEEHWHLTLLFFGEMNSSRVDKLIHELEPLASLPAVRCSFSDVGALPNERRPRLVYLKATPKEAFQEASRAARKCAVRFRFDSRPFLPHLTLARARKGKEEMLAKLFCFLSSTTFDLPSTLRSVSLMNSTLTPQGPSYRCLKSYPFLESYETA